MLYFLRLVLSKFEVHLLGMKHLLMTVRIQSDSFTRQRMSSSAIIILFSSANRTGVDTLFILGNRTLIYKKKWRRPTTVL